MKRQPWGKILVWLGASLGLAVLCALAGDVATTHTFVNGETVTADTMNGIIGNASIQSSFFTAKTLEGVVNPPDLLLSYNEGLGAFRTITFTNVVTNVFWSGPWNLLATPTNRPYWTFTNNPVVPVWDPTNAYWEYVDSSNLVSISMTNGASWPLRYVSPAFNFTYAFTTNLAHGLTNNGAPVRPQDVRWVLTCVSQQDGFYPGDELPVDQVQEYLGSLTEPAFAAGADTTNVWIHCATNASLSLPNGYITVGTNVTGNSIRLTNSDWQLKCYARFWP